MVAELKMKESDFEVKKWLKINENGKEVGKAYVYA
jgi:hypothetical protein